MNRVKNKNDFRKNAKQRIKQEVKTSARCKHYPILKEILAIIKNTNSKRVLLYMPTLYEPNLLVLRRQLARKYEPYIPLIQNISFKMVKLRGPFYKSKFGIKENRYQNEFKKRIDVAIVPVIGVDGKMARVGHGKGYYDIFFSKLKYKPIIIFVEIKDMFTKSYICEDHDIIGDFYITPTKKYLLRGKNDRDYCRIVGRSGRRWNRVFNSQKGK
ncbi:5-formyltetrahydrofolate cycloligase [Campylobacter blaseri]|uniref:5-formyltetrahydrofolate cyclo-ligase n=1 Tax=Campylobacter blaseri TaxID=2042961 RepID=A0A2P8QZ36_9BACT|nr:5-formyltetrahydrofolate cyclo-ligase [Campylobacter blaseri]PSM51514.1 5-formyltetrahydrofolate cyclo-ligase [Campylobacter blaseri]PSM52963.1 5-formyltetrahydrofolate cyclo-ligase [Campylobacter blaseri]QKF86472.1 5-formyltetrahydrofolate cycloligase [Campylobacter blaseri]